MLVCVLCIECVSSATYGYQTCPGFPSVCFTVREYGISKIASLPQFFCIKRSLGDFHTLDCCGSLWMTVTGSYIIGNK